MISLAHAALVPDPREEKLPVWARRTLSTLRRNLEDETRRADAARLDGGPEDTDTVLDPYDDVPVRLPKGQRVRFLVGEVGLRDWVDVRVSRDGKEPRLQLMAGGTLQLHPQVTNVVEVSVADRW